MFVNCSFSKRGNLLPYVPHFVGKFCLNIAHAFVINHDLYDQVATGHIPRQQMQRQCCPLGTIFDELSFTTYFQVIKVSICMYYPWIYSGTSLLLGTNILSLTANSGASGIFPVAGVVPPNNGLSTTWLQRFLYAGREG